jgi:iron-sulfur cluster repair protein YtfE (RIC family)
MDLRSRTDGGRVWFRGAHQEERAVTSLSHAGHEHHQRIDAALDGLPMLADMLDERPRPEAFEARYAELLAFVTGTLVPHMSVVESTLYPELDRLMQNRHSMVQMRREHESIGGLIARLGQFGAAIEADALGPAGSIGLRRVLYRLYALLKVHLAEEEEYLRVLDHNLSPAERAELVRGLEHAIAEPL